ncbi:hypothetical protein CR983_03170 [Candidatus Saccharibacteria bacterium]|nr:MAG: hypothetical protein CR983_03170 [Candidatus Saccharibacteria bacterium]
MTDSFWFTPLIMGIIGMLLAQMMIIFDKYLIGLNVQIPLSDMGADGGRGILAAIAGSVLGVAATSFSITTAVLATASTTYGPRLVRNFMADQRNQFVLGSFGMSFIYALMVLRSIRDATDIGAAFVPSLAINMAIVFGVINVILLIYFIHHIAESIQISTLVSKVRDDLIRSIESLYPLEKKREPSAEDGGEQGQAHPVAERTWSPNDALPSTEPIPLRSQGDGFISWIDFDDMIAQAGERDAIVKLLIQPGDYVFMGKVLAHVWQDDSDTAWVSQAINISQTRTPYQDIRYAVQQPVDITIRALSPGINDPYTAINALRGLGSGLTRLCQRQNADNVLYGPHGNPRVHKKTITIEHMLDSVFRTLRSNVIGSIDATMAVLALAEDILQTSPRESYRNIIIKAVESIDDAFMDSSSPASDKQIVKNATSQIVRTYDEPDRPGNELVHWPKQT